MTVLTIHNLAFQGWFPASEAPELTDLGQDEHQFSSEGGCVRRPDDHRQPPICSGDSNSNFGCGLGAIALSEGRCWDSQWYR